MSMVRWYITVQIFSLLHYLGLARFSEWFARITGLRQALRRLLWNMGEGV